MPKKTKQKSNQPEANREKHMATREWFNVSEAAEYLHVSRLTVYKLMDRGALPYTKIKGLQARRIKKEDLDALFERS